MLPELDDYDWQEAFEFAHSPERCIGDNLVPTDGFTRDDVEEILAMDPGQHDGASWVGLFQLKDGRFAFLEAGCDYTGWD